MTRRARPQRRHQPWDQRRHTSHSRGPVRKDRRCRSHPQRTSPATTNANQTDPGTHHHPCARSKTRHPNTPSTHPQANHGRSDELRGRLDRRRSAARNHQARCDSHANSNTCSRGIFRKPTMKRSCRRTRHLIDEQTCPSDHVRPMAPETKVSRRGLEPPRMPLRPSRGRGKYLHMGIHSVRDGPTVHPGQQHCPWACDSTARREQWLAASSVQSA